MVFVSKNGGGIGRLNKTPASPMASPIIMVMADPSKIRVSRGRMIFSTFS